MTTETNCDVERANDRANTARELRDCLTAMLVIPDDVDELNTYSTEVVEIAATLLPAVVRVAKLRETAAAATAELCQITTLAVDYLDACAELAFHAFATDTGESGEASL